MTAVVASWADQYIGIPFVDGGRNHKGADCWGLFALILKEQFDIEVPDYTNYVYGEGELKSEISAYIQGRAMLYPWVPVEPENAQPGHGILLKILGYPIHVSVVVGGYYMLHTEKNINSMLERYDTYTYKRRILGIYRHVDMPSTS